MSRLQAPRVAVVGAVLADGTTEQVRPNITLLVDQDRIAGLWFDGDGPDPDELDAPVIDGSGSAIVPGMVDSHAHLSMPGGARWIERGRVDPTDELLAVGEENGEAMVRAGIRWARDVGAPRRADADGRVRALSLSCAIDGSVRPSAPTCARPAAGSAWTARCRRRSPSRSSTAPTSSMRSPANSTTALT